MTGERVSNAINKLVALFPQPMRPPLLALLTEFAEALIEESRQP